MRMRLKQEELIKTLSRLRRSATQGGREALAEAIDIIVAVGNDYFCAYCYEPLPSSTAATVGGKGCHHGQGSLVYCSYKCLRNTECEDS